MFASGICARMAMTQLHSVYTGTRGGAPGDMQILSPKKSGALTLFLYADRDAELIKDQAPFSRDVLEALDVEKLPRTSGLTNIIKTTTRQRLPSSVARFWREGERARRGREDGACRHLPLYPPNTDAPPAPALQRTPYAPSLLPLPIACGTQASRYRRYPGAGYTDGVYATIPLERRRSRVGVESRIERGTGSGLREDAGVRATPARDAECENGEEDAGQIAGGCRDMRSTLRSARTSGGREKSWRLDTWVPCHFKADRRRGGSLAEDCAKRAAIIVRERVRVRTAMMGSGRGSSNPTAEIYRVHVRLLRVNASAGIN
ncbi:hypothetical protein DFH09DRAFT_1080203 [Mycena vulgaris]|nr:hypothetical protein DFH09DRAFT_1080203 [Mycena vulgaris]